MVGAGTAKSGISFGNSPLFDNTGGGQLPVGNNFDQPVIGSGATSTSTDDVVVGEFSAGHGQGVVVGYSAKGQYASVVLGGFASDNSYGYSTVIGNNASCSSDYSIVIGQQTTVKDNALASIVLGASSVAGGENSIVIGPYITSSSDNTIALGYNVNAVGNAIAIGSDKSKSTKAIGQYSIALGPGANANNTSTIAIGNSASASSNYSITIGSAANTNATNAIAIGHGAHNTNNDSALIKAGTLQLYFYGPGSTLSAHTNNKAGVAYSIGSSVAQYISFEDLFASGGGGSSITLPSGNNFTHPVLGEGAISKGSDSIVIGKNAKDTSTSGSNYSSIIIGTGAQSLGNSIVIGNNSVVGYDSIVIGNELSQNFGNNCIIIGNHIKDNNINANTSKHTSISIGCYTSSSQTSIAIGTSVNVEGYSSTVIGNAGSTQEDKVLVLCAGDYGYAWNTDGNNNLGRTQLYLIAAGSELSSKYLDGEAGLGYCVQTGNQITASGCIKLSSICTLPFKPNNGEPNIIYP